MFDSESSIAKTLIIVGLAIAVVGLLILLLGKTGIHLGRLPGDIRIEGERGGFYFPIVTSIVLSVVLTLVLRFFSKH